MEISFDHTYQSQFYTVRFKAAPHESVPFLREIRFWGVDRVPCPRLSTLAALIVLKDHPMTAVTLRNGVMNPPVCTALAQHFGVEIHPEIYEVDRRDLAGGEKTIAPVRFSRASGPHMQVEGAETLTWISLDDLRGPFGGLIRTNLDAFELSESEKNLIVALCCAGKDVGHILMEGVDPGLAHLLHQIGLELIDITDAA